MAEHFVEIKIPQQRNYNSIAFPYVLSPTVNNSCWFGRKSQNPEPLLESLLLKAVAVLFRGFDDVKTAEDFDEVVKAFGYDAWHCLGGFAPRHHVVGRVFTANDAPPDQKIHFHHEMPQLPEFPSKLLFFCEVEPGSGGETPQVLSHIVYERMKQKHPEFVEQLEQHGLIYMRIARDEDDPSSSAGRGWKSAFFSQEKSVAEERAAKLGIKLEDNGVKMTIGPVPGIRYDQIRQRKVWFNGMLASLTGWKDASNDPARAVTFGNGEPLPSDILRNCLNILEEESVAIPWQKGDVLLIDNWAVLLARSSFDPPRRVLASLCK